MGVSILKKERRNDIRNTNELTIVFIQLHIQVLCAAFCPLSQHSYSSFA